VLLRKVETLPEGEREKEKARNGRLVLAEGEATGHAHAVKAIGVVLWAYATARILAVQREAILQHEEHSDIAVPPGNYEIIGQREYRPEGIRRVLD